MEIGREQGSGKKFRRASNAKEVEAQRRRLPSNEGMGMQGHVLEGRDEIQLKSGLLRLGVMEGRKKPQEKKTPERMKGGRKE